mmetsp:Transcript_61564/g.150705  ORF Transcript_61564/g.150705 Transcript_61564/m.150705 type:complete len:424 (-) Transcript_61564:309-1580(-)
MLTVTVKKNSEHQDRDTRRRPRRSNNTSNDNRPEWSTRDLSQPTSSSVLHNTACTKEANADKDSVLASTSSTVKASASSLSYQERISAYNEAHHHKDGVLGRKSSNDATVSPSSFASSSAGPPNNSEGDDDDGVVVQALALQMYHLPGNSWCGDWWMFMRNNHPVFGICCHDKVHPIGSCQRIIALIGTVLFGLALTNMFYLFYLWNPRFDQVIAQFVTRNGDIWVLTTGMLLLWTVGSSLHCAFNLAMWHIAACACCQPGGCCPTRLACCPSLGKHVSRVLIVSILACAVLIVLLRVAITNEESSSSTTYDAVEDGSNDGDNSKVQIDIDDGLVLDVESISDFQFVAAYLIEMVLSLFVYYPIGGTILFSGILSCGCKIPLLGGRPYEVALEQRRLAKKSRNKSNIGGSNTPSNLSDIESLR